LSAPYRRELKAEAELSARGISVFVPKHYEKVAGRGGRVEKKLVPVLHNLLFVKCTRNMMKEVKDGMRYIQYRTAPVDGKNVPIVVPERQMEDFMRVCRSLQRDVQFFTPDEISLAQGTMVRIIGGEFDGVQGIYMRVKGHRNKRVVIQCSTLMASAIEVKDALLEKM